MPALLMSTSRRPYRCSTWAAASLMLRAVATSRARGSITRALFSLAAAVFAFAASRAVTKTTKPREASWRDTSNPIPRFAPVTKATRVGFLLMTIASRPDGKPALPAGRVCQIRGERQRSCFRLVFDAPDHATENEQVNWIQAPPVDFAQQSPRFKPGATRECGPGRCFRGDRKFEPRLTGNFHFCSQEH